MSDEKWYDENGLEWEDEDEYIVAVSAGRMVDLFSRDNAVSAYMPYKEMDQIIKDVPHRLIPEIAHQFGFHLVLRAYTIHTTPQREIMEWDDD